MGLLKEVESWVFLFKNLRGIMRNVHFPLSSSALKSPLSPSSFQETIFLVPPSSSIVFAATLVSPPFLCPRNKLERNENGTWHMKWDKEEGRDTLGGGATVHHPSVSLARLRLSLCPPLACASFLSF
ncbi:pilin [Sesbania bispinosa]|nr:pilin [Sesbania bispinosa]